jgi:hypothetical protein
MILSKTEEEIKKEIKYLCNFYEKQHSGSVATISYMDFIEEDTLQEQLKIKSKNRELAIDIVTGEKEESTWNSRVDLPILDGNFTQTIGPKIFSMTVQETSFTSYEDLHTDLLNYMEKFTQGQPVLKSGMSSFDLTLTNDPDKTSRENFEYSQRKIMSKLLMCGNYIAVNNRRGPGTTLLAHPETISKYFYGDKQLIISTNYTLIESNIISKDKFIVLRADINGGQEDGLFVIKSLNEDKYFMKETPSLKNRIMWFHIK